MKETETRTRIHAEDAKRLPGVLAKLGFQFLGSFQQTDVMFDRPDGSLFNAGYKIRIRREQGEMELTYKGSMLARRDVSIRTEANVRVTPDQFDACRAFLEGLGYPELFRIVKHRQTWERSSVKVTIDDWPIIGPILELEGPEQELDVLSRALGAEYRFENYRLRDFFTEIEAETGKSLAELQKEYESQHNMSLGRLDLLARS